MCGSSGARTANLSSSLVSSGVRIAQSQVLCVVFWRSLFVLFSLGYCLVCLSICAWLPFVIFKLFLAEYKGHNSINIIGNTSSTPHFPLPKFFFVAMWQQRHRKIGREWRDLILIRLKFNPLYASDRLISQMKDGFNKYGNLLSSLVFASQKRNYKYTKSQSYYHVINRMWVDTDRYFKTNLEMQFYVKNGFRKINNSLCRATIWTKTILCFFF